jgi:hypothetical protein
LRSKAILASLALSFAFTDSAFADCGPLKIENVVQMVSANGAQDFVPVTINGVNEWLMFDTGGLTTMIGRSTVANLKLPIRQGRTEIYDLTGNISRDQASIQQFDIGVRHVENTSFPIAPEPGLSGILSLNYLLPYDVDVDFGTDKLKFFSRDHCPGWVLYWAAPAVAVVPFTLRNRHIMVHVTLDGHDLAASIDTGEATTALRMDIAEHMFALTMGAPDTAENGILNGDTSLKTYGHVFKSLTFGDIAVNNPHIDIIPNAMGRNADRAQLVTDRTKSEKDLINAPDVIVGMDVLRKLHIYLAFGENKMYISAASAPLPASAAAPPSPAQ